MPKIIGLALPLLGLVPTRLGNPGSAIIRHLSVQIPMQRGKQWEVRGTWTTLWAQHKFKTNLFEKTFHFNLIWSFCTLNSIITYNFVYKECVLLRAHLILWKFCKCSWSLLKTDILWIVCYFLATNINHPTGTVKITWEHTVDCLFQ